MSVFILQTSHIWSYALMYCDTLAYKAIYAHICHTEASHVHTKIHKPVFC